MPSQAEIEAAAKQIRNAQKAKKGQDFVEAVAEARIKELEAEVAEWKAASDADLPRLRAADELADAVSAYGKRGKAWWGFVREALTAYREQSK